MAGETVLITGASSGIGRELAGLFAADGSRLVLVARRAEALQTLAEELRAAHGVEVKVLPKDLAEPGAPQEVFEAVQRAELEIDVLVNNAGFGQTGTFVAIDAARQAAMVQVNVAAVMRLARLFAPGMVRRRRGGLLNVGSTAGFQPGPNMAVYYATKAFVNSLSEALHHELRRTGVQVTCLAPGPTLTEFVEGAGMEASPLFRRWAMDAGSVARAGYRGFRAGKALVVPGAANWLASFLVRFTPRGLVRRVTARLHA